MQSFSFKVVGDRARVVPVIVSEQKAKFTVCSGTSMEGAAVATRVAMAASFADVELPSAVVDGHLVLCRECERRRIAARKGGKR